jgi:very-short-patch-repair endonuclease
MEPPARQMVVRARNLRRRMTLPEAMLWEVLRKRPGGFKFRRQHPIGGYVLDFFCMSARIAIEVDGAGHEMGTNPQRDARRDRWLNGQGIKVIRIPASDVLQGPNSAARMIISVCAEQFPSTAALGGGPPPRSGEDRI